MNIIEKQRYIRSRMQVRSREGSGSNQIIEKLYALKEFLRENNLGLVHMDSNIHIGIHSDEGFKIVASCNML